MDSNNKTEISFEARKDRINAIRKIYKMHNPKNLSSKSLNLSWKTIFCHFFALDPRGSSWFLFVDITCNLFVHKNVKLAGIPWNIGSYFRKTVKNHVFPVFLPLKKIFLIRLFFRILNKVYFIRELSLLWLFLLSLEFWIFVTWILSWFYTIRYVKVFLSRE